MTTTDQITGLPSGGSVISSVNTTYSSTQVIDFINNSLRNCIDEKGWTDITQEPYIFSVKDDFLVLMRERDFKSLEIPHYNDFTKYESLNSIRNTPKCVVFAYDSEWMYPDPDNPQKRLILSWQFSFIKDEKLVDVVFLPKKCDTSNRLAMHDALSIIFSYYAVDAYACSIDTRNVRSYDVTVKAGADSYKTINCSSYQEAVKVGIDSGRITRVDNIDKADYIDICLLMHAGLVDITSFNKKDMRPILKQLSSVQKGLVSTNPIKVSAKLLGEAQKKHKRVYPFNLIVRDTMCQAPAGFKSLDALGDSIGVPKLTLAQTKEEDAALKARMGDVLVTNPLLFLDYAANDAVVTLLYTASLYGENRLPQITITAAASSVMFNTIAKYLGVNPHKTGDFNILYRGLRPVDKGLVPDNAGLKYIGTKNLEAINLATQHVQALAAVAYKGGYNGCSIVGFYDNQTYDADLRSAYPLGMTLIPDINWDEPIAKTFKNITLEELGEDYFKDGNPFPYMFAYIESFSFPKDTAYPCFPVTVDGNPIYVLNYKADKNSPFKEEVVAVTGPELYLAYRLGATAVISECYLLNPLEYEEEDADGNITGGICKSLSVAVKQLVSDRNTAKRYAVENGISIYLADKILKHMVNSGYGKTSTNVKSKRKWSAKYEDMEDASPSQITNPVSASWITAIVRCTLIAAQNEITKAGGHVYSVTTDGFISDFSYQQLKELPLAGFRNLLCGARKFLTDNADGEIWEIKHQQTDLLNFTTRGNVSLNSHGVCAHSGCSSGLVKDSYEDRLWLMDKVLSRTEKLNYKDRVWATFKDILMGVKEDFCVEEITKSQSLDFDLKRMPLKSSFETVYPVIAGKKYEIANFNTVPYENIEEYVQCRKLLEAIAGKKSKSQKNTTSRRRHAKVSGNTVTRITPSHALRTVQDWEDYFFSKLETPKRKRRSNSVVKRSKRSVVTTKKACRRKNTVIRGDDIAAKKIRNCLYAYRAGLISIPLIDRYSVRDFYAALNESKLTKVKFCPESYKNYGRRERWPDVLTSDNKEEIDKFLSKQEPLLSQICSLKLIP